MKMTIKWLMAFSIMLFTVNVNADEKQVFRSQMEKVSYGIGVNVGRNFIQQGIEVELEAVIKGLKDAYPKGKIRMTEEDLHATMMAYQEELRQKQTQARKVAAVENSKAGDAFLAENKGKKGVMTLPSGLQYKILSAADGLKPTDADTVACHYRGSFINGTEFDSSYRTGSPATFMLEGVIPGWKEALKLMPVGSKWQLFIPPGLAYGERGMGQIVGPNATLVYEVELLAIK